MNYFTSQNRKDIKRKMKSLVKENLGRCIGIQLLYLVPYALLMILLYTSVFGRAFALMASNAAPNDSQLMYAMMQGMNTIWLVLVLMFAITGPLQFGLMHFYIGLSRDEDTGVSVLFHPFTSLHAFWAGIRMVFTLWLRSVIWSILPTLLFTAVVMTTAITVQDAAMYEIIGAVIQFFYTVCMIPIQIKLQTYQAGWLLLVDDDSRSAWEATRTASQAFRGSLSKLFLFNLSFLGWYVLIAVILVGCAALGSAAMTIMSPGMAIAVLLAVIVAAICLMLVLNGFLTAYTQTSFFGMYNHLNMQMMAQAAPSIDWEQFSYKPIEPSESEQHDESDPSDSSDDKQ